MSGSAPFNTPGYTPIATTNRVTLAVAGYVLTDFSEVSIERDLENISGRFSVVCLDQQRLVTAMTWPIGAPPSLPTPLLAGQACTLSIDGQAVLTGWLDKPSGKWSGDSIGFQFSGRDVTGDLVDCAAFPTGPSEFRNITLPAFAAAICKPFGIRVRADVDTGAAFPVLSVQPHETGRSALEKAARQRAVLVVSDGVGGLLLTRGGSTRGPAPLRIGELIQDAAWDFDNSHRFSDYYVKGQTPKNRSGTAAPLTATVTPPPATPAVSTAPGAASVSEAGSIVMTGHAIDPEITRWRPTVLMAPTQSGQATAQEQAEWASRVARGKANRLTYTVLDWRAGDANALWLPNQVVNVLDPYAQIDNDMLIAGVTYTFGERGLITKLRMVGVTAYDMLDAPVPTSRQSVNRGQQALTPPPQPLAAP